MSRTMLLWCPDWPVVAAEIVTGTPAATPVAVLHANRVVACSESARADGVRRGLRRREAQSRCPQLTVVDHDPARDAQAFEPVVAAVEQVAVGVEVIRPGACALAARGPARYFGGEEAAAERIVEQVAQECAVDSQVGVADGAFAAGLAARLGRIVAPGQTRAFLAGTPVEALERPELTDLLRRLGLRTLGDFAALPASDVLTRFGFDGALAHRLAAGADHRPLAVRRPPPDLDVADTFDEPLDRVDVASFAGRALAERLHARLAAHGLACTRLGIEAVTADGQELHRVWRHDGLLGAAAIAERVRWQLDGWLSGTNRGGPVARPTAGLVRLRLIPDGVLVHLGLQPGLWGETGAERDRAHRALSRVQGILGPEAVVTPVLGGGRSADDQARLVPWGDERVPARPGSTAPASPVSTESARLSTESARPVPVGPARPVPVGPARPVPVGPAGVVPVGPAKAGADVGAEAARVGGAGHRKTAGRARRPPVLPPWPGRLPTPAPALVLPQPLAAVVQDATGAPVGVSARLELTGSPSRLFVGALDVSGGRRDMADAGLGAFGGGREVFGDGRDAMEITGWAGPWPIDERWWAPAEARRRARFQIGLADGRAMLLFLAAGHWAVEAIYD